MLPLLLLLPNVVVAAVAVDIAAVDIVAVVAAAVAKVTLTMATEADKAAVHEAVAT